MQLRCLDRASGPRGPRSLTQLIFILVTAVAGFLVVAKPIRNFYLQQACFQTRAAGPVVRTIQKSEISTAGVSDGQPEIGLCAQILGKLSDAPKTQCQDPKRPREHPVTLVTGYFSVKAKQGRTTKRYVEWIELFLHRISTPVTIYTDCLTLSASKLLVDTVLGRHQHFPGLTHANFLELDKTPLALKYKSVFWTQECHDHELHVGHNYWLYLAWMVKVEALKDALSQNVYCSDWFLWTDIGAFRTPAHTFRVWPSVEQVNRLPMDRVVFGLLTWLEKGHGRGLTNASNWGFPSTPREDKSWLRSGSFTSEIDLDHIIGTYIGFNGNTDSFSRFYTALQVTYDRLLQAGHLIVKDQTVYNAMFLWNRDLFSLVASRGENKAAQWAYMQSWLGKSGVYSDKDHALIIPHWLD